MNLHYNLAGDNMKKNKKMILGIALGLACVLSSVPVYAERNAREQGYQAYFYQENFTDFSALSNYVLPISNRRKVTIEDLKELSTDELALARNEIYARHGKVFQTEEIQSFFNQKSWYKRNLSFQDASINAIEKENAAFIRKIENEEASRRFLNIHSNLVDDIAYVLFDMDGDGIKEKIEISVPRDNQILFQIGTASLKVNVDDWPLAAGPPVFLDFIKLRDDDKFKDILFTYGSGNDYGTHVIIRYQNNRLYEIGSISSWDMRSENLRLNGKGEIRFQEEDFSVGNYKTTSVYQLSKGKLKKTSSNIINVFSKALQPIILPTSPSSKKTIKIKKGERVLFRRRQGLDWYEILSESGKIGWMQMKDVSEDGALDHAIYQGKSINGYWFFEMSFSG